MLFITFSVLQLLLFHIISAADAHVQRNIQSDPFDVCKPRLRDMPRRQLIATENLCSVVFRRVGPDCVKSNESDSIYCTAITALFQSRL